MAHVNFDHIIGCGSSIIATGERLYITQKISQMTMPLFEGIPSEELNLFLSVCRHKNLQAVTRRMVEMGDNDPDLPPEALRFIVNFNFETSDGRQTRIVLVTHMTPLTESAHELSIALLDAEEVDAYFCDLLHA